MNTTSLHIKIEPDIKMQAQKTADELGISLSSVVKALLKQFVRTKQLSVGISEKPSAYLLDALQRSDEEIKKGKVTSFKNGSEALEYLDQKIIKKKHAH